MSQEEVAGSVVYGESFVYDLNGTVRASYDLDGVRTAAYLAGFGFGEVLARVDSEAEVALRDRLGTTVGWVDSSGGTDSVVRDAYGVRGETGIVVPFGYTGHAEDPTGLVWGRARCIRPSGGGWLSADPVSTQPRYSYVRGRVSYAIDPTGRSESYNYAILGCIGGLTVAGVGVIGGAFGTLIVSETEPWLGSDRLFGYDVGTGVPEAVLGLGWALIAGSGASSFVGISIAAATCGRARSGL